MQPFKLSLKDPEFGVVVVCKRYYGLTSRAYYLSIPDSIDGKAVWLCCKTGKQVKDKGLSAFVMMHLLGRIKDYYPLLNFC